MCPKVVADEDRAVPFPATVPMWMEAEVEKRVGVGKRWPNRSALLLDALTVLFEVEDRVAPLAKAVREQTLTELLEGVTARRKALAQADKR